MKIKKYNKSTFVTLNEDTVGDLVNGDVVIANEDESRHIIMKYLDRCYKVALLANSKPRPHGWVNLLIIGEGGVGKTAITRRWAREKGVNLLALDAQSMDKTDLGGLMYMDDSSRNDKGQITKTTRLSTGELDPMMETPSVLFLDEINRADQQIRGSLLTLIQDHTVISNEDVSNRKLLKNFLFTVGCLNPPDEGYDVDSIDRALRTRFCIIFVNNEPEDWLENYMIPDLEASLEAEKSITKDPDKLREIELLYQRKIDLIKTLVLHKDFKFDSSEDSMKIDQATNGTGNILNSRTLENLVNFFDGTKDDFLKEWTVFCGSYSLPMAKTILNNYKDIEDKANDALKHKGGKGLKNADGEDVEVKTNPFQKKNSIWDGIAEKNPELADL